MIQTLYTLITQPFRFIRENANENPAKLGVICVLLASLCIASEANGSLMALVSLTLTTAAVYAVLLFFQSVTIDFFAQWILNSTAKSLRLFYWFGISLLPLALWIPLDILNTSGKATTVIAFIKLGLFILILSQQIAILKAQYNISTKRSLLLYVFPFLFTGASFIGLALILFFLG